MRLFLSKYLININDRYYSYFCEHNIFGQLFKIMVSSNFTEVTVQIIQSFGMLLSLHKATTICKFFFSMCLKFFFVDYLLSNKVINETLLWKFDFQNEEIVEYYIAFLKSLAIKLSSHPIEFFFNEV